MPQINYHRFTPVLLMITVACGSGPTCDTESEIYSMIIDNGP